MLYVFSEKASNAICLVKPEPGLDETTGSCYSAQRDNKRKGRDSLGNLQGGSWREGLHTQ